MGSLYMKRKDLECLQKLIDYIEMAESYVDMCQSFDVFVGGNKLYCNAAVQVLFQIGEASRYDLSDEAKAELPDIPWRDIYGMRNRIAHAYDDVDMTVVWETIRTDLPFMKEAIRQALNNL